MEHTDFSDVLLSASDNDAALSAYADSVRRLVADARHAAVFALPDVRRAGPSAMRALGLSPVLVDPADVGLLPPGVEIASVGGRDYAFHASAADGFSSFADLLASKLRGEGREVCFCTAAVAASGGAGDPFGERGAPWVDGVRPGFAASPTNGRGERVYEFAVVVRP